MLRMRSFALLALLLAACTTSQPAGPIDEAIRRADFRGAVLVAKDGEIVLHQGYGGLPKETRFWIASMSKQFAASAILELQEEGKLSVDDPITKFLPDVPADKQSITLRQLMSHMSGFSQQYAADGIADRGEAVKALLATPLKHPAGTAFAYSNDAYNLIAAIVEIAAGEPFESYLQRKLLDPAGLRNTGFWGASGVAPANRDFGPNGRPNWGFRGATGMYSTAEDLYRWHLALQSGRVLSAKSVETMLAPHVDLGKGEAAAFGWFRSTTPYGPSVWTRGTEDFGHNGLLVHYPERKVVIVAVTNAGSHDNVPVARKLAADLAPVVLGSK